jgi:type I restriction enzyme S subunit
MKSQKFKQTEIGMIPENWEETKIGNLGELKNGVNFNRNDFGGGFPIINVTNLFRGRYATINNLSEIKKETLKNPKNYFVKKGDILFARSSLKHSGTGQAAMVFNLPKDETVFSGFIIRFRKNLNSKIDNDFLNYLLRSDFYRTYLKKSMDGTTITNINQEFLSNLPINLPHLKEQELIAKILSSLDEKIELNRQIDKNLEAIGQAIFKEFFINEQNKEWIISKIGDELKTILGGTPDRTNPDYWNGNINWINSGKVNEFRITEPSEKITQQGLEKSATRLLPRGSTVLAITGATLGQVSRLEIDSCANQSVIGILENERFSSEYIYYWIKNEILNIISHQTGGAQQHINKTNVDNYDLLIPDEITSKNFNQIIKPIFKKISINCFQNQVLSQIRDSLLPKLMSGKIRVL